VVKRFLGEGGKKKVYLAHDTLLDRDVAFALIKTEGLDDLGRDRITREAQAMGRLGAHPHIVSVFDLGDEDSQPYIVTELMGGGDVEELIEKAPGHRPPLARTLEIAIQVCEGLEFAHDHGIVHRDLKPGNVWLAADLTPDPFPAEEGETAVPSPRAGGLGRGRGGPGEGVAKLGDFGLAVALDRSRLTQAGMMVGTVAYMPPEQAMGGEVTAQSDLYSLGAMLYEMVTGRPPFVGDESVAIITQHLNTSPVAPSWHSHGVPAGLEALILRLLEKDPAKRPASAAEVLAALESVKQSVSSPAPLAGEGRVRGEPKAVGAGPVPARPEASNNPVYRRTFVGREQELKQLQSAFDAATSGQGSLVMVVGEPGIGKTSVCEQLSTYATVRGGKTLVGHCYEEGSLSLPYLPFVEGMRSYVLAREPAGLKQDLGSGAGEVARIVSEIRDRLPPGPHPDPLSGEVGKSGDPEEERYRLLQAVTAFLRNAAAVQPLVIVLEDLHDADRGTLDLLVHLAHNLSGARLLIVGTYRDIEVDRTHPLSSALAELRRGSNFQRVPLRGLTADEVQRMMAAVSQQEISWPFAELVHRQTEGNPLFVQEMLRFLVEEGLVERREGSLRRVGEESLAGRIPEGLRDVIGKRLSRLSDRTNQALSVASVIGREFRLDVLQRIAGLPEEDLYAALEEATAISIVEERSAAGAVVIYRFTHAFFRQTLYEETIAPRRIRLHQQVARALEIVYGRRLEEHATEMAEHYAYSSDPADLAKAVAYGEMAANRALAVFAYGEAVGHLEQALKVQEVLDPDDKSRRCELLLRLGHALTPAGELRRVADVVAPEALALAEALRQPRQATEACLLATEALTLFGGGRAEQTPEYGRWSEQALKYAVEGSAERVLAQHARSLSLMISGHRREALELVLQAFAQARKLGEPEGLFRCAGELIFHYNTPGRLAETLQLAEEFCDRPATGVSHRTLGLLWHYGALSYLAAGDRAHYELVAGRLADLAGRTQDPSLRLRVYLRDILLATMDGELERAVELGDRVVRGAEELGMGLLGAGQAYNWSSGARLYLGSRLDETLVGGTGTALAVLMRSRIETGDLEAARQHWRESGLGARKWAEDALVLLGPLLEVAVLLEDPAVRLLSDLLRDVAFSTGTTGVTCVARHLGAAALLLGELDQARAHYERAIEACARIRFRPELALSRLQLGELLLEHFPDERPSAIEQLDAAIAELRAMKMQPALERALRHKEVLKA